LQILACLSIPVFTVPVHRNHIVPNTTESPDSSKDIEYRPNPLHI
jgi:hypothetical protein